eukprot:3614377-Rhodomonas_salina.2
MTKGVGGHGGNRMRSLYRPARFTVTRSQTTTPSIPVHGVLYEQTPVAKPMPNPASSGLLPTYSAYCRP